MSVLRRSITRQTLLSLLRNQTGDPERDHGDAEAALQLWLREDCDDKELADAWEAASEIWWYA